MRTKRAFTVHHFLERCSIKVCHSNLRDQALVPELREPLGDLQRRGSGTGDFWSGLWGTGLERRSRQKEEEGCKVCGRGERRMAGGRGALNPKP